MRYQSSILLLPTQSNFTHIHSSTFHWFRLSQPPIHINHCLYPIKICSLPICLTHKPSIDLDCPSHQTYQSLHIPNCNSSYTQTPTLYTQTPFHLDWPSHQSYQLLPIPNCNCSYTQTTTLYTQTIHWFRLSQPPDLSFLAYTQL